MSGSRVDPKRLTKANKQIQALLYPERGYWRPRVRGDCKEVARPCPYVSCRFNLYLDVRPSGALHLNFPDTPVWDLKHPNCALDMAERSDRTLEELGAIEGITRERIRQIQEIALRKLREVVSPELDEAMGEGITLDDQFQLSSEREA